MSDARVALVVTTIGRTTALDALLRSVESQSHPVAAVVIADQSGGHDVRRLVDRWQPRLPLIRVASGGGASKGRNDGIAALPDCDVIGFPDDDVWYQRDTVERAVGALRRHGGCVSGTLRTTAGTVGRMGTVEKPRPLDERTLWRWTMEATCFFERGYFTTVGNFNPGFGVGSCTPWQSGEIADLLLRGLRSGFPLWFDPAIRVYDGTEVDPGNVTYRLKARRYARGTGRVLQQHHGHGRCFRSLAGPAAQSVGELLRGRPRTALLKLHVTLGRAEGMAGRVLPLSLE
ncbi:glycosyltransferase family 2 protein [Streptomyces sp. DSM 40750]|uniref:glycosyltransferase family 2 protein n=1 Tax=Streptomyces sp. DSM 40750 TaxID=2801030 RepID=UPI00214B16A2|nr:glycosyltransferase [Streptomyces sp. DSM 40750]UUU21789.1 glycosyltransferase [Streptomyces sp. DSM 40750]